MIKNIVFDLGNVLVEFLPDKYLRRYFNDQELRLQLEEKIFQAPEWNELDRGNLTPEELTDRLCDKHPLLAEEIRFVGQRWLEMLNKKDELITMAEELKGSGYRLYILSNIAEEVFYHLKQRYDFFDLFSGQIISGSLGIIKPEKGIYLELIDRYELKPEESIFIDDLKENIEAAQRLGFKTIHCTDTIRVQKRLNRLLS